MAQIPKTVIRDKQNLLVLGGFTNDVEFRRPALQIGMAGESASRRELGFHHTDIWKLGKMVARIRGFHRRRVLPSTTELLSLAILTLQYAPPAHSTTPRCYTCSSMVSASRGVFKSLLFIEFRCTLPKITCNLWRASEKNTLCSATGRANVSPVEIDVIIFLFIIDLIETPQYNRKDSE